MAIGFAPEDVEELRPQITVFGVGGAGSNAVHNMITSGLTGVTFCIANTDAQALGLSCASSRIQIGRTITQGLGAGARPEIGRAAAEESLSDIVEHLKGSHMCFIAAGMGGGTGTGAAPVIARAAKELDILTVGVVTKPFQFEGAHRMRLANQGIEELQQYVDTLIVIPNQNLFRIANERTTFAQAFQMADQVLHAGVRGVTDLMLLPGLINLDFADVRSVMSEMGKAMMGTGEAEGEHRAIAAAEAAISNPLLDDVSLKGARAVLINITGGDDLTLFDVDEATNRIRNDVDPEANIIFGAVFNDNMTGRVRVSVVATGIDGARSERAYVEAARGAMPVAAPSGGRTEEVRRPAVTAGSGVTQPLWPTAPQPIPAAAQQRQSVPSVFASHAAEQQRRASESQPQPASDPLDDIARMVENNNPAATRTAVRSGLNTGNATAAPSVFAPTASSVRQSEPAAPTASSSIKGLFGFMRSPAQQPARADEMREPQHAPAIAPEPQHQQQYAPAGEAPEVRPLPAATASARNSADVRKDDDRLEIPAFLRRQIN